MQRVLVLTFSKTAIDPRVLRQIHALRGHFNITVAGSGKFSESGIRYIEMPSISRNLVGRIRNTLAILLGFFEFSYWSQPRVIAAEKILEGERFDLLLANELSSLPLALRIAKKNNVKVLFDAHEFYPGHMPERLYFRFVGSRLWSYLTKKYIPLANLRMTVSQGIIEEYKKFCGVDFFLFPNSPFLISQSPAPLMQKKIRMVHAGGFSSGRRPELMAELMNHLDERFELDFIFVSSKPNQLSKFKKKCELNPRIRFADPVPVGLVSQRLNQYDIGLYLLPIRSLNQKYALPNKLFEYIQARLAIAVWPSPEMGSFVKNWNVGWVSTEPTVESMALTLNRLTSEELIEKKMNTERAAVGTCCEKASEKMLSEIERLLSLP